MSVSTTEELIIRWMDGENMTEEDINRLKKINAEEPEMILNPKEFSEIRHDLRITHPVGVDVPNADLFQSSFNSRLEKEIAHTNEIEKLENKIVDFPTDSASHSQSAGNSFPWLKAAMGMAACLLFGLLLGKGFSNNKSSSGNTLAANSSYPENSLNPVLYSADQNLTADYVVEGQNNVIVIEGLTALPDDLDLFNLAYKPPPLKVTPNKTYPQTDY